MILQSEKTKPTKPTKVKMKLNKLTIAAAAFAVTAILGASTTARAQANNGDIILGFESTTSPNVYEVDLGASSQFIGASSALTFNLSTSDLSSTTYGFGSSWASSTAVQWGAIGATSQNNGNLFTTWNPASAAPPALSSAGQGSTGADVVALLGDFNTQATITPGNTDLLQTGADQNTDGASFAGLEKTTFNLPGSQLDANADLSIPAADAGVLDLYELANNGTSGTSAGTLLGQFTLASDGVLTFTPEAVPEPSAYALGLAAIALFVVLKRRQSIGQA